jgi:hypothetical protein
LLIDEMSDNFGVCFRDKARPGQLELTAQLAVIFDDSIVNDRNAIDRVGMRVPFVCTAVCCPAGVADAYTASKRLRTQPFLEVLDLSDRAPPRKQAAFKRRYTG